MAQPASYAVIALVVLGVIVFILIGRGRSERSARLTPLATLAFLFVLAGITFGGDRRVSYSLFGIAIVLSVLDMTRRSRGRALPPS